MELKTACDCFSRSEPGFTEHLAFTKKELKKKSDVYLQSFSLKAAKKMPH